MDVVQILDKKFALTTSEETVQNAVKRIAEVINKDMRDKNPLFVCVLNGAFMFAADLMKTIDFPCQISFVKLASYEGLYSTEKIKEVIGLNESVVDRHVVVVEDIVDTGFTMEKILLSLSAKGAKSIKTATLLLKPEALQKNLQIDYVAMEIPNDFIVGYGLDYNGYGRNLKGIYTVIDE